MGFEKKFYFKIIEATRVPWKMMYKGAALTLIRGFTNLCPSSLLRASSFLQLFQAKKTRSPLT